MSSRNVSIQRGVYDRLRKEMRADESFSRLFARLLQQRGSLLDLYGAWSVSAPREERGRWLALRGARPHRGRRR
ncbi:MAG: hypothetical protein L3K11_04955 [Thermoplasmata archaeon]|nr:hypothetical protein [Thermoplasmata archaeon]